MRYHEFLTEAKVLFTPGDVQKAAAESEYNLVYLTMTGNGEIHIGDLKPRRYNDTPADHPDVSGRRALHIDLWVVDKRIYIRHGAAGENLKPKVQQALRSLRDAGIIDASWRVETSRGPGHYVGMNYVTEPNPVDQKSLDELVDKAIRLSPVTQNMVFYHGTSMLDWEKIQKVGLHPLGFGSNTAHGMESRGKHQGNQNVLYLASTMDKAYGYAKTRVEDGDRKLRKVQDYHTMERNKPVVLAVQIPDPARLVADDDTVNRVARAVGYKFWRAKPREEQERLMRLISQQRGFAVTDPSVGEMLWRETDAGFAEIMAKLPARLFKAWRASLSRDQQVGYKGFIPPKFLKRVL